MLKIFYIYDIILYRYKVESTAFGWLRQIKYRKENGDGLRLMA